MSAPQQQGGITMSTASINRSPGYRMLVDGEHIRPSIDEYTTDNGRTWRFVAVRGV